METGPKIAQKYISRPLLIKGHKYQLRMHVLLQSLVPLKLYVHNEHVMQNATKTYTTDDLTFNDFETHMTVMGYLPGIKMDDLKFQGDFLKTADYVKMFNEDHSGKMTWEE